MNSPLKQKKSNPVKEIENLLEIERDHLGYNVTSGGFYSGSCLECIPPCDDCPTLLQARAMASRETKITVALILAGDKL